MLGFINLSFKSVNNPYALKALYLLIFTVNLRLQLYRYGHLLL